MLIQLQNALITEQRIQVICLFLVPCKVSFGAVRSADEKHLSANGIVVIIFRCLVNNFSKSRDCCCVRVTADLLVRRSCESASYFHFVNVSAWGTLSLLIYATNHYSHRKTTRVRD